MNPDSDEVVWQRLSKALFGGRRTADEGLFTYRVMEEVRRLQPTLQELAWLRFLRWAVPVLGVAAASLVLAVRIPAAPIPLLMEKALFQHSSQDADPLAGALFPTEFQ